MCLCFNSSAGQNATAPAPGSPESAIIQQQRSLAIQRLSIERQDTTIRVQSGVPPSAAYFRDRNHPDGPIPAADTSPAGIAGCAPVPPTILQNLVENAAAAYHVQTDLINAVIHQESAGYPCAVSEKGAMGLMQLMPATASLMGAAEPFDINQNVNAGTRLLAELLQRYNGDLNRVLGAYNAGTAAVDRAGGPPAFPETLNYIRSIMARIKLPVDPKLFGAANR